MKAKETKFDQFGALKPLDLFFSRLASLIFGNKRYQKEFLPFIIISWAGYSIAVFLSMFSSFFIVSDLFVSIFKNIVLNGIVSIISLLVVEALLFFSLKGFFKFLFKGLISNTVFLGISALFGFALVFVLTTNGIALMMSEKVSKTSEIVEFHEIEHNTIKLDYKEQIEHYKKQIEDIKNNPLGWSGGKRTNLTKEQLNQISSYNNEIKSLKQELKNELNKAENNEKTELKQNRNETTSEANKYYWIFALIVGTELLSVFYIVFSAYQIHKESNTDQHISDKVQDISNAVGENIFSAIEEQMFHVQNMFALGLQKNSYNFTPFEVVDKNKENEPEKIDFSEQKKPVVVGGFFANKKQENPVFKTGLKTDLKTPETSSYLDKSSKISTSNLMYLQKHKAIVKTLKKYEPETLNNSLINSVLSEVKKQKYKSRSTVQKVHEIIKVYGYDKINKEGGVEL